MTSVPTPRLRLDQQGTGDNPNAWGVRLNAALGLVDESEGVAAITVNANVALTSNNFTSDQARRAVLRLTGTGLNSNAPALITIPAVDKGYVVHNQCAGDITIGVTAGAAVTVRAGQMCTVYCDGTTAYIGDPTLDTIKLAAADLNLNAHKITGLAAGTIASDAARIDQTGPFQVSDATASAALAKAWATQVSGEVVTGQGYSAYYYAQMANTFNPANYYTKTQADAAIVAQAKPVAARSAKSANYTVVAADRGVAFDLSGSFTLSLTAAAALGAGFFFWVKKKDGSGTWVVDPNGSETIDGLTTINVYQEAFLVYTDGTAWYTQDRPRGWISLATVSLTGQNFAQLAISQGFGDTEITKVEFEASNYLATTPASTTYPRLYVKKGGALQSSGYYLDALQNNGTSAGGQEDSNTNLVYMLHNTAVGPFRLRVLFENVLSTVAGAQTARFDTWATPFTHMGFFYQNTASALQGFALEQIALNTASIDYTLKGWRA